MEARGVEPLFPRCDRGVLPLHHAPIPDRVIIIAAKGRSAIGFFEAIAKSPKNGVKTASTLQNRAVKEFLLLASFFGSRQAISAVFR